MFRFAPSVKTEGENYHVIDVTVYLGKQREGGIGMLMILRNFHLLSVPRQKLFVCKSTTDQKHMLKMYSLDRGHIIQMSTYR